MSDTFFDSLRHSGGYSPSPAPPSPCGLPGLIVFRTAHHPDPSISAPQRSRSPGPAGHVPSYYHTASPGVPSGHGPRQPAWAVVSQRQLLPPNASENPLERYGAPSCKVFAVPVLVPLRSEHLKGGTEAHKAACSALTTALQVRVRCCCCRLLLATSCRAETATWARGLAAAREMGLGKALVIALVPTVQKLLSGTSLSMPGGTTYRK